MTVADRPVWLRTAETFLKSGHVANALRGVEIVKSVEAQMNAAMHRPVRLASEVEAVPTCQT